MPKSSNGSKTCIVRKLFKISKEFAEGITNGNAANKCFMVCWPLSTYLNMMGFENSLIEGEIKQDNGAYQHFWLEVDGLIVDPTASQFKNPDGKAMPNTYVGKKPYWYKEKA